MNQRVRKGWRDGIEPSNPAFIEQCAKRAAQSVQIGTSPMNAYPLYHDDKTALEIARSVVRSLRDLPHEVLDLTRGSLAPGDAAQFWNRVIDHIAPVKR